MGVAVTGKHLKVLLLLLWAWTLPAVAEDSLYVHGITEHYVACSSPCNETNPGLSFKRRNGSRFVHFGGFENTHKETAVFYSYGQSARWLGLEWGAAVGMAAGYREKVGVTGLGLVPMFVLSVERGPVYVAVIPGSVTLALRFGG